MQTLDRIPAPEHRPEAAGRYLRLGLWLRGSIVGAAFATAGFAALLARAARRSGPDCADLGRGRGDVLLAFLAAHPRPARPDGDRRIVQPDGDLGFRARPVLRTSASS